MTDHQADASAAHTALRRITPRITIGAGPGFCCTPRPDLTIRLTIRDGIDPLAPTPGPYTHLEVGLRGPLPPQLRPAWRTYAESIDAADDDDSDTGLRVFSQVPTHQVAALIDLLATTTVTHD